MSACAFGAYDAASQKSIPGRDILRYLAGYGLGRAVIQWFRTDKNTVSGNRRGCFTGDLGNTFLFFVPW